jgi:hypothetical protein
MSDSATFSWIGTLSADWNAPTNWADVTTGQTPAVVVPGSLDAVIFNNGGFSGSGSANTVTFQGRDTVLGLLNAGTLVVPDSGLATPSILTVTSEATAIVQTVLDGGFIDVSGTGAVLSADSIVIGNVLNSENGGTVETNNLTLQGGGQVAIDQSSIIEVGQSGTGATGDLTIDQGHTLSAGNGYLFVNIVDSGVISGSSFVLGVVVYGSAGQPGAMIDFGQMESGLTGTGTVEVQAGGSALMEAYAVQPGLTFQIDSVATLIVEGPIVAGDTIIFAGTNGILTLDGGLSAINQFDPALPNVEAAINGFNASDTIIVEGNALSSSVPTPFNTATYVDGNLNLLNGTNVVSSLSLTGSFSGDRFDVIPTEFGGEVVLDTAFSESPSAGTGTQDSYTWIGGTGAGDWNDPANWEDVTQGQTPAVVAPGSLDIVSVSNATLTGNGDATSLTLGGQDNVLGNIDSSQMIVAGTVVISNGATELVTTTVQVGTGTAAASLSVVNDSSMIAGNLTLGSNIANQVSVDGTSIIQIGSSTAGAAGALTIDPGYSMSGEGSILGPLVDNGLVESTSLTIGQSGGETYVPGQGWGPYTTLAPLSGTGSIEVLPYGTISVQEQANTSGLTFELDGNAVLDLAGSVSADNTIEMNGDANTLNIGILPNTYIRSTPSIGATIIGFNASDKLIVAANYPSGSITGAVSNNGTLELLAGTVVASTLDLPGFSAADAWAMTPLHSTEDALTVSCFGGGTNIATPDGIMPIERLRRGDSVVTVSGRSQPIKWIGQRRVNCRRHPVPGQVMPIRIAAHAFGENLPRRALQLSPDHAVFVDDVLIPIKYLVNGTTVAQIDVAAITYYHLELPRHDVILAEALPTESYLETGGRSDFDDGGNSIRLYPDFGGAPRVSAAIWEYAGYAPLIVAGDVCERVRARLAVRAAMLGYQIASKEVVHADKGQMHAEHADSSDGRPEPSACFA